MGIDGIGKGRGAGPSTDPIGKTGSTGGARDVTATFRIDSHGFDRGVAVGDTVGEVRWAQD